MAENVQQATIEQMRAQLLARAYTKAAASIAAQTTLSPGRAKEIAPRVVDAAAPAIRAEHTQRLAGVTGREAVAVGAASLAVLALDLTVFTAMAVRGPRWTRPAAALACVAHAGLYAYSKRSQSRIRAAARAETVRGAKL